MEPKHNAPKLLAIICVIAVLVAIYCSCFVPKDNVGNVPAVSPKSNTLIALPTSSTEPDTPPVLPAPPTPSVSSADSIEADVAISIEAIPNNIVWLGDNTINLHQDEKAVEPSVKSLLEHANAHAWDAKEVMDHFEEATPSLEYTCPYDIHKCVSSVTYVHGELTITWDIYLFSFDGVIGTWIVNNSGNDIVFYGDAYLYEVDNYNVHLGKYYQTEFDTSVVLKHLCIYPQSFSDSFMVVTYHEEIDKIS